MKYIVCDEHTLGAVIGDNIQILHASVLKGATFEVNPGYKPMSFYSNTRPATGQDFTDYRVQLPPDFISPMEELCKQCTNDRCVCRECRRIEESCNTDSCEYSPDDNQCPGFKS